MTNYRIRKESYSESGARYGAYVFMFGLALAWWPALAAGASMVLLSAVFSMVGK